MNSTQFWNNRAVRILCAVLFWALVWQLASMAVGLNLLLPGPVTVLRALLELIVESKFWGAAALTILRILGGFLLGTLLGFLVAVLTEFVPALEVILSPAVRIMRATPVASFILLCMLWLTSGFVPALIAGMMVLPIVWENVSQGFRQADIRLLEMSRVFGMSPLHTFFYIYLPSTLPYLRAACITAIAMAFKSGVAAEVLCQPKRSVGTQLYYSKIYLETENLFAWTAVVVVLSICMEKLISRLLRAAKV